MDRLQWAVLRPVLRRVTRAAGRLAGATFGDLLILRLYFWSVVNDRPVSWAVRRTHYNRSFRPRKVPSVSQLNRRVASDRFQGLLQRVHDELAREGDTDAHTDVAPRDETRGLCVDGKALVVSPVSQDRDARVGHVPGGFGKGYKLHAVVSSTGQIPVFSVMPLNRHEVPVAERMLDHFPRRRLAGTLVMADGNYDAHELHKRVAARGGWLITRPRGRARHPVTRRQMGPARRTLIDLWDRSPELMRRVYHDRQRIERTFGQLTCIPGLLGPLPSFVRGLARVRRWVGAKITLYHVHRRARITTNSTP